MDKKVLSELALYYGDLKMPQGFEINSSQNLCVITSFRFPSK